MKKIETLLSIIDALKAKGAKNALRMISAHENTVLSYAELFQSQLDLAEGLLATGLSRGTRVGIFAPTCTQWYISCLAIVKAGGCVVPIDVQVDAASLKHVLQDGDVRVIFTTVALASKLGDFSGTIYLLDGPTDDKSHWKTISVPSSGNLPTVLPEDFALLFYTSGTTGHPKGVPLQHGKLAHTLNALAVLHLVEADDIVLMPLPMHHVYPIVIGVFYVLCMGLEVVLPGEVTGPAILRAMHTGHVTVAVGVPRLFSAMVSGIFSRAKAAGSVRYLLFRALLTTSIFARRYLGLRLGKILLRPLHKEIGMGLRILTSAGSKLDEELAWQLEGIGWAVGIGYGLTETAPILSFTVPGDGHVDSVGKPIPGVKIRIDSENAQSKSGEIVAFGPNIFDGYLNLPEKTETVFTSDGWFKTGDLGFLDSEGYLHVQGRASTLIVAPGGEKIQPEDIESVYLQNPYISEIGILQYEGRLVAIVVPNMETMHREGHSDADWSIRRALAQQARGMASYQRIMDFALTSEPLPRTRMGKLRRHLLTDAYKEVKSGGRLAGSPIKIDEMSSEDRQLLQHAGARSVWDWLCQQHAHKHLTLDTSPHLDLGIDSLEWLNLTLEIRQRAGVELSQDTFGRIETLRDLLREVTTSVMTQDKPSEALLFEDPDHFLTEQQRCWLAPMSLLSKPFSWSLKCFNRIILKSLFRLKVVGVENVPQKGPYVICPNHVSHLDPFAVAAALSYSQLNTLYWGGWQGVVMRNRWNRWVSRLGQAIPIDAQNAALSSLAVGAAVLKRQLNLSWFPEGRRSPEGILQTFRPGIGLLVEHYHVPVIPVYIKGTFEALPTGKYWPSLRQVTVVFGEPLTGEQLAAKGSGSQQHERITSGLYQAVKELGERS